MGRRKVPRDRQSVLRCMPPIVRQSLLRSRTSLTAIRNTANQQPALREPLPPPAPQAHPSAEAESPIWNLGKEDWCREDQVDGRLKAKLRGSHWCRGRWERCGPNGTTPCDVQTQTPGPLAPGFLKPIYSILWTAPRQTLSPEGEGSWVAAVLCWLGFCGCRMLRIGESPCFCPQ